MKIYEVTFEEVVTKTITVPILADSSEDALREAKSRFNNYKTRKFRVRQSKQNTIKHDNEKD